MRRFIWFAMFISLMTACSEDPTQLLVVVDSDLQVPSEMSDVEATVKNLSGEILASHEFRLVANKEDQSPTRFYLPLSFGILAPD